MNALFAGIRLRLVGWSVLVLGLILMLAGTATYFILARSLLAEADRSLAIQGDQVEARLHQAQGDPFHLDREGFRGGFFYVLVTPTGQVIANPQSVDVSALSLNLAANVNNTFKTVTLGSDHIRVYTRRTDLRGIASPILLVGESLVPEEEALRGVIQVLLLVGGGGVVLTIAGAWFLSGRALVPIQAAFRRQQEFVADASHELRTPLTVLRSAHDLLDRHRSEPLEKNRALLDDIRSEIGRMERLTDDLLTLARSDQGTLYLEVGEVDLGSIASDVVTLTTPLAAERGVRLAYQREEPIPTIEGDPDRLQQLLLILVDNALKHTPAGGDVTLSAKAHGADVVVQVSDTGEGIEPEHLPRLFDRFYRVDTARSRNHGGTGLGLAIAKSLAEAHGGQLTMTSTVGTGTTATVQLSAIRPDSSLIGRFHRFAGRVTEPR